LIGHNVAVYVDKREAAKTAWTVAVCFASHTTISPTSAEVSITPTIGVVIAFFAVVATSVVTVPTKLVAKLVKTAV
jgi:hypothetical protein